MKRAYKLSDEKGLFLFITPNGSKYWRYKYRFGGKEKKLAFGVYPEVSLAEAHEKIDKRVKYLPMAQVSSKKASKRAIGLTCPVF